MQTELENYLAIALQKLEAACAALTKQQGFDRETEKMKMLTELVKEQVKNENTRTATR